MERAWRIEQLKNLDNGNIAASGQAATHLRMPVPEVAQGLSCNASLAAIAPAMRAYQDPILANARAQMLGVDVPTLVSAIKRQAPSKQVALDLLRQQADEYGSAASSAAQTAAQSDGYGNRSIPLAATDQLELNFACAPESIHASSVCNYIVQRWAEMQVNMIVGLVDRCW